MEQEDSAYCIMMHCTAGVSEKGGMTNQKRELRAMNPEPAVKRSLGPRQESALLIRHERNARMKGEVESNRREEIRFCIVESLSGASAGKGEPGDAEGLKGEGLV